MGTNGLFVQQLQLGPMDNFVYLVGAEGSPETAIVDAAWDIDAALAAAEAAGRTVTHALVSHWHADHTNGLVPLLHKRGVRIHCHAGDVPDLPREVQGEVVATAGGDRIEIGALTMMSLHTPGHTPGSTTWHLPPQGAFEGAVFSGDTLFVNACGRCDFRGGDPAQMYESLKRLGTLGDGVRLYPGHDYGDVPVSTIGRERANNPYYARLGSLEEFLGLRMRPRT